MPSVDSKIVMYLYPYLNWEIDYSIPPFYDSLIAKLIVWGKNREFAINRAKRALEEFHIEHIKTTIPFHRKVLDNPHFIKSDYDTSFIEKHF